MPDQRWKQVFSAASQTDPLGDPVGAAASSREDSGRGGQRIGKYQVTGVIGRGGMGEVYSARDTELGRSVALKFLPHETSDTTGVERLISEARAASGLNHPNIVTVYEVIRSDSSLAIAMELVEGVPLRALCQAGVPVGQAAKWISQVAQALAAAHQHRLIHRDVKPENIVVRPDGYVKVLDFGLARNIDVDLSATTREIPPGTLRYMSPEQVRREVLTPASDVFALGLVFFELLTGQHAFQADSPFSTAYAIAHDTPPLPSTLNPVVPRAMDALVKAMLAKVPADRPSTEQVVAALAAGDLPQAPVTSGRNWRLPAIAVGCGVLALAFYSFRERNPPSNDLKGRPLASRPGAETMPVISPDGSRVAFAWAERQDRTPEIFVQSVSADEPHKLLSSGTGVRALAWSADGSDVLAIRNKTGQDRFEIVAIPANGAPERILGETLSNCTEPELDASPDGQWIAMPDCGPGMEFPAIYLFSPRSSERKRLTLPPASARGDMTPKFSPDGRTLAFKRAAKAAVEDVFLVPVEGGTPRRISNDGRNLGGLAWLPGGRALVISSAREGSLLGLWRLPTSGTAAPQRLTQVGYHAIAPSIARESGRLVWVNQLNDTNVWRAPFSGAGSPERIIASTLRDQDAHYGPDGRLAFRSARSGSSEIWIAKADGTNPVRLTEARGPVTGSPRWSPAGRLVVYDSRPAGNPDVYLLDCPGAHGPCGKPRRLTTRPSSDVLPSWSSDGAQIYFSSDLSGVREVWRMPSGGGEPTQLTKRGGFASRETADGKWLYFSKPTSGIWRMPGPKSPQGLNPDAEQMVVEVSGDNELSSWDVTGGEVVYLRVVSGGSRIEAYHVERKTTRVLFTSAERITGLTVSPDSKWVAFGRMDRAESNVMVADGLQ